MLDQNIIFEYGLRLIKQNKKKNNNNNNKISLFAQIVEYLTFLTFLKSFIIQILAAK